MRKWLLVSALALVIATVFFISYAAFNLYYCPMLPQSAAKLVIPLDKKTSATSFANDLKARHLITSSRLFVLSIRVQGLSIKLKAGFYELKPYESAQQFLMRVVKGDVLILPFQIIEGTTQNIVASQLLSLPYITLQPHDWDVIRGDHLSAEGLLLAETYYYEAGTSSETLLMTAHTSLMQTLNHAWEKREPSLPYKNAYEMLTAASIIEKEAAKSDEQHLVSSVIVNRLKKRMPLQMDPTVIYALGTQYQGRLTHQDLSVDSPYNTYKHYGLPPTPIAMVGKDAIEAAAHPAKTSYLYYVARGDGGHSFSETYEQQKKAILLFKNRPQSSLR